MAERVALVTGGNSGIGKWTAIGLAQAGMHVVFTSRDEAKGRRASDEIREHSGREPECMPLDLASFASIRAFAKTLLERHPALHVVVANAGLILGARQETSEGFEAMFGVNHLGHFLLLDLLRPALAAAAPSRVVVVASHAHRRSGGGLDFDDLQSRRSYSPLIAYGRSKLANILYARELARRLKPDGITVNAVHPGVVATGFARDGDIGGVIGAFFALARPLLRTEKQGAETSVWAATAPELADVTGQYFASRKPASSSRYARDDEAAKRLWTTSERLVSSVPERTP